MRKAFGPAALGAALHICIRSDSQITNFSAPRKPRLRDGLFQRKWTALELLEDAEAAVYGDFPASAGYDAAGMEIRVAVELPRKRYPWPGKSRPLFAAWRATALPGAH